MLKDARKMWHMHVILIIIAGVSCNTQIRRLKILANCIYLCFKIKVIISSESPYSFSR